MSESGRGQRLFSRAQLLYGEWLRRERRRGESRGHLRAALESFRTLGAVPWAERAEAELRATGETVRKRDVSAVEQLTSQELQIAGLVTEGLPTRRSPRSCTSARAPSTTTCEKCSPSSASPPAPS